MEPEIIHYTPALADEVCELQRHGWGPDVTLNRRYLDWKYHRNPYMAAPVIALARAEGRLVGMVGMCGASWQVGTREVLVPIPGDWVVAPGLRGKRLAVRLMAAVLADLAARGVGHSFGLSAGDVAFRISVASGWRSFGPLLLLVRCRRAALLARAVGRAGRLLGRHEHVFQRLDRHLDRRTAGRAPLIVEKQPRCAAMAELRERLGGAGRIRQRHDASYIDWRYRNPFSHYRFLHCDGRGLEGYLVLQTSARRRESEARILDWEAANADLRHDLLRAALDWGRFERVSIWSATLPADAREMLVAAGFAPEQPAGTHGSERPAVLVRPTCDVPPTDAAAWTIAGMPLLDRNCWDVRMADSDGF